MSELEAFLQEMRDFKSQCINIANASMFPPNMLSSNTLSWRILGCHELNGSRDGEKDEGVLTQGDENIPISRSSHYISLSEIYESSARWVQNLTTSSVCGCSEDWILAHISTAPVCVFESGHPPYLWARVLQEFVLQGRSRSVCCQEAQKQETRGGESKRRKVEALGAALSSFGAVEVNAESQRHNDDQFHR